MSANDHTEQEQGLWIARKAQNGAGIRTIESKG